MIGLVLVAWLLRQEVLVGWHHGAFNEGRAGETEGQHIGLSRNWVVQMPGRYSWQLDRPNSRLPLV